MAKVSFLLLLCLLVVSNHGPQVTGNRLPTVSIHILDDESLISVFFRYRPAVFGGGEDDKVRFRGGRRWNREDDGTNPLTFAEDGDASYSGRHPFWACLVCTTGTPVADMLAHSPPLPLAIDYDDRDCDITVEEEGIILSLEQHDRVRRIRLHIPAPNLQNLIMVIDKEYPVLHHGTLDGEQEYGLDASWNTSSTTSTSPRTDGLCPSNKISITHDCRGPRHACSYRGPPIQPTSISIFYSNGFHPCHIWRLS